MTAPPRMITKLGYTPSQKIYVEGAPKAFLFQLETDGIAMVAAPPADWAHLFVNRHHHLQILLDNLDWEEITQGLWVSWPKKSSGILTDITEQTLRDLILPLGWVDTKVCAIDDIWSALKFVRRKL